MQGTLGSQRWGGGTQELKGAYAILQFNSYTQLLKYQVLYQHTYGRVAKWLERLTAEQNIDGSSRRLGSQLGCSLTVHPTTNWYLVATLGKLKAARKGTGYPTSLCRRLGISVISNRHSPTYGIVYGTNLHFITSILKSITGKGSGHSDNCQHCFLLKILKLRHYERIVNKKRSLQTV